MQHYKKRKQIIININKSGCKAKVRIKNKKCDLDNVYQN